MPGVQRLSGALWRQNEPSEDFFGRLIQACVRVDHPRMTFMRPDKAYEAVALYPSYILIPCSGYMSPALPFDFFSPIHLNSPVHAIGTSRCRDVQSYS